MQIGHARGQWYGQQAGTGIARISNLASGGHGHAKIRAGTGKKRACPCPKASLPICNKLLIPPVIEGKLDK